MADYELRLLRVLDYIHANPTADLSLDALAEVAAMSRFHWHRVFVAMTGETLADAVRRIRLHRAACWLAQTDASVAEVATRAGYPNVQSFTRIFRDYYRLTPAAFRRRGQLTSPLNPRNHGARNMYPVEVKAGPARRLFAVEHTGPYTDIGHAYEKLGTTLGARGLWPRAQGMVAVYYDDPSAVPAAKLRSHAGVAFDDAVTLPDGLQEVRITEGRLAILRFKGHYSGLKAAYDYLYGVWLPASGEDTRDAPPFEVYLNTPMDTAPDDLLTDICVPVE